MTSKLTTGLVLAASLTAAHAGSGLYYVPNDTEESIPIKWSVGTNLTWDDNTSPGGVNDGDENVSINPYVGVSFVAVTPQTTWDVYARLGLVYYFDDLAGTSDDTFSSSRAGVNLTHRFNERLRFTSRNFISYEMEPDYSYGFASSRQNSEYLYWQTDNSVGYRWSERVATYTGIQFMGLEYDNIANADRTTWTAYNQFRYQLSPQSVLTASYRYSETSADGLASDSTNQYLLAGIEHRFSPNTILVANAGAQFRSVDGIGGRDSTSPFLELALRSQINTQFGIRAFTRLGMEDYDTVVQSGPGLAEYSDKLTLRVGVSGDYQVSKFLGFFGGVDVITSSFDDGTFVTGPVGTSAPGADEAIVNAYIGTSLRFTDTITGSVTYNFTNSDSDVIGRDYDRNRVSVGVQAEF